MGCPRAAPPESCAISAGERGRNRTADETRDWGIYGSFSTDYRSVSGLTDKRFNRHHCAFAPDEFGIALITSQFPAVLDDRSGAIVLKKSLFGDARFIGALRSGIQKIAWGTSRFSA